MKRENSFVGRGKKREELRKWTILLLLFAGLSELFDGQLVVIP